MNRFLNSEISIKINKRKELTEFLELCEKYNLEWRDGENPTEWSPLGRFGSCRHGTNYRITLPIILICSNQKLTYLEDGYWERLEIDNEIVEYQDFKEVLGEYGSRI